MMNTAIKIGCLMMVLLLAAAQGRAQGWFRDGDTLRAGEKTLFVGKEFDSAEVAKMKHGISSRNAQHIAQPYIPFSVTATNGGTYSNEQAKGKVTMLFFWMVTAGGNTVNEVNYIYDSLKRNTAFQVVGITPEADLVADFEKEHEVHFPVVDISSMEDCHRLNFKNGFPSYIILNKAGIVTRIGNGIAEKESDFSDSKASVLAHLKLLLGNK